MQDQRNHWQPADALAKLEGCHPSTIRKNAVELDELAGEQVYERRAPTVVERRKFRGGLQHVYRLRPVYSQVAQIEDARRRREEQPDDLRDVEIDWRQFFVVHDGDEFVSLRAMVEDGGLYSRFDKAKEALERTTLVFHRTVGNPGPAGGRPKEDLLLAPADAQRFAAQAGTDVGKQIARVIIEHHNAYQRIRFGGDVSELGRLVERTTVTDGTQTLDLIISLATEVKRDREQNRQVLGELRRRITALEAGGTQRRRPRMPRSKASLGADDLSVIRKHFDRALNAPALELANRTGIDLGMAKHSFNQRVKALVGKPRANWTAGDFVLAVELLEANDGINLHHIFEVDEAQMHLVLDASFCSFCGCTYYSSDCPSCSDRASA